MTVLIPDYCPVNPQPYPGGILPGLHDLATLLREHRHDSGAIVFIADMVE